MLLFLKSALKTGFCSGLLPEHRLVKDGRLSEALAGPAHEAGGGGRTLRGWTCVGQDAEIRPRDLKPQRLLLGPFWPLCSLQKWQF